MSNPIMQMMGGMLPGGKNNPLQMIMQLRQSGGNPQAMINQMLQQNPQLGPIWNQVQDMARGKSEAELQQMAMQQAQKQGIDPQSINNIFSTR